MIGMNAFSISRLMIMVLSLLVIPESVVSAEEQKYLLTEKTWKELSEANKLMESDQASEALLKLNNLLSSVQDKAYDTAVIHQTAGYAYSMINDHPSAIKSFRNALVLNALPRDVAHDLEFNLAQLLIFTQQYQEGLNYFERWIKAESEPGLDAFILAGTAYYEAGQYHNAIPYAKNVITLKKSYDESWYQLLLTCYLKTSQYENAARLLEKMLEVQPENKTYWQQLLAIWQHADNDRKTLATMELMHLKGLLDPEGSLHLINMYRYLEMPYKAANLLQSLLANESLPKNSENLELLGNSWLQAKERERAAETLLMAAELTGDASLYVRVGQIYFDLEDYSQAMQYLQKGLAKGSMDQASQSQLLLGIAAFNQQRYEESQQYLQLAAQGSDTRDQAQWWLQRIADLKTDENKELQE